MKSPRLALAGLIFALVAPLTYAAERLYERWRSPVAADPALILATTHTAFYWRVAVAVWFAATVAAIAARELPTDPSRTDRIARALAAGVAATAVVVFVVAWLFP